MELLRIINFNQRKLTIIYLSGIIRDLSSFILDLYPKTINENIIEKINKTNSKKLPKIAKVNLFFT